MNPSREMHQRGVPVKDGRRLRGRAEVERHGMDPCGRATGRKRTATDTRGDKGVKNRTRWSASVIGVHVVAERVRDSNPPGEATGVRREAARRNLERIWDVHQAGGARRWATKPFRGKMVAIRGTRAFEYVVRPRAGGRREAGQTTYTHHHSDGSSSVPRTSVRGA